MKRFLQRLALLALLVVPWVTQGQTLTVANGTDNSEYVPIYGYWADAAQHNQMIYPATSLSVMNGMQITQMVFYIDGSANNGSNTAASRMGTWTVSLGETTDTALSGLITTTLTQVYEGYFDCSTGTLTLQFDDPYTYHGGNLLVDINHAAASYNRWYFLGIVKTGAAYTYNNVRDFLPKVTFSYSVPSSCATPGAITTSNITAHGATISWTAGGTETYWYVTLTDQYDTVVVDTMVNTPTYTFTGLTPESSYTASVRAYCSATEVSNPRTSTFTTAEACPDGMVCIGTGTLTNSYLPTYTYYNYSLTQQIYTAAELGQAGEISSIDFYKNGSNGDTRNLDIYLVSTTKTAFSGSTDWITVTAADLVYSGNVTFANDAWTTITLDSPFSYDGTNNIAIIVDDNTGSYVSSPSFRVFDATSQAIRIYSDGTNYDPTAPTSYNGTVLNVKNRIRLAVSAPSACPRPTQLAVNYTGGTSATVSWNSNATLWNIRVNGVQTNGLTANPTTLTGLDLGTNYTIMVQANCGGGDTSEWSNPVTFTTDLCDTTNMCAITITVTDAYGDGGGQIQVVDSITNEVLGTYTNSGASSTYTLNVCNGRTLNFVYTSTDSWSYENGWSIADVNEEVVSSHEGCAESGSCTAPTGGVVGTYTVDCSVTSCRRPADLAATEVGPRSVTLSWTERGQSTSWVVAYAPAGDTTFTEVAAATNSYTLTGLNPETAYTVKVRSVCSDQLIRWGNPINFSTQVACPAPTDLTVTAAAHNATVNWNGFANNYTLQYAVAPDSTFPTTDSMALVYDDGSYATGIGNSSPNDWGWAVMYPASMCQGGILTKVSVYEIANYYDTTYTVMICTGSATAPETPLATQIVTPMGTDGFHEITLTSPVTIGVGQNLWIVLEAYGTYVLSGCNSTEPNNNWVYNNGSWAHLGDLAPNLAGYGWMVRGQINPFDLNAITWTTVNNATAPASLTSLTPETDYITRVKALCGAEDGESAWTLTSFTTPEVCPAISTFPWKENFDNLANNSMPECWNVLNLNSSPTSYRPHVTNSSDYESYCGGNHLSFFGRDGDEYVILPRVSNFSGLQLRFHVRAKYWPASGNGNHDNTFMVGVMSDPTNASTFTQISSTISMTTEEYTRYVFPLDSCIGHGNRLAIKVRAPQGRVYSGLLVDAIVIEEATNTIEPTAVAVDTFTATTATLSWTENNDSLAAGWQIAYSTTPDFNPASVTPVDVTTNPFTLTGLAPVTTYYVYVRTNVGSGSYSSWSDCPAVFTTPPTCPAVTALAVDTVTAHTAGLSWTAGGSETAWDIYVTNDATVIPDSATTPTATSNTNAYTVTGLAGETHYYAYVRAHCSDIDCSIWESVNFTTLVACPVPTAVAVSNITTTTATVSWTSAASSFIVMLGDSVLGTTNTNSYDLTGLTPNTSYTVQVKAVCGGIDGESQWTSGTNFMTAEVCPDGMVCIGTGTATNSYLPTYTYYNYSLTQQIYTAAELGQAGEISSIDFYKNGTTGGTRNLDIYLVSTTKTSFTGSTDWITVTAADRVFSGDVTFANDAWTTIEFDDPFLYDGTNNVAIIVDDNTGTYVGAPTFRVFDAASQAIRVYSDGTNYGPMAPTSYNGTVLNVKNRIRLAVGAPTTCARPTGLAATLTQGRGTIATLNWTAGGTETAWVVEYDTDADFTSATSVNVTGTPTANLTGLTAEATCYARVKAVCSASDSSRWSRVISFFPTNTYSITVNDSTATNGYVPIYGYYVDDHTKSTFIIPADELTAMQNGTITKMTFYSSNASTNWGSARFEVYMTETTDTAVTGIADFTTMTQVMTAGPLGISDNIMEVTLTTPYQYMGGNLMIAFNQPTTGSYQSCNWYGVSAPGASYGGYGTSVSQKDFLPKTRFDYLPAQCEAPVITVGNFENRTASFSWTCPGDSVFVTLLNNSGQQVWGQFFGPNDTAVNNMYFPENIYPFGYVYVYAIAICGDIADSNLSDWAYDGFAVTCDTTDQCTVSFVLNGQSGWQGGVLDVFDTISGAIVSSMTLPDGLNNHTTTYQLCTGRTYRVAFRDGTGGNQTSFNNVSFEIVGPNGETYFTASNPATGTLGYFTHTCAPECWPMPLVIGNENSTTTSYYTPVNNYYNYTLTETIIDAAEIGGAMPINGIRYYFNYATPMTSKTNCTIYLQPTTKTAFSSTTDIELLDSTTAVMVYTGALNCSQGWNEFTFTTPYQYDGTGNLMVIVDDNSGSYNSSSHTFRTSATTDYKTLYWYSDSYNPDPTSSTFSGSKSRLQSRVVMALMTCDTATCHTPVVAEATTVGVNNATVAWTSSNATTYSVTLTSGTSVVSYNTTADTTYTFTNLTANTDYTVAIRALCSATDSSEAITAAFHTECDMMATLPYTYGFEGATTGSSSNAIFTVECWKRLNNCTGSYHYPYVSSSNYHAGSRSLYWYSYTSATASYGTYEMVVLPGLGGNYTMSDLRLKFWSKVTTATYRPVFYVGVMTDPTDYTTFVATDTIAVNTDGNTDYAEYIAYFNNYTGTGRYVAIAAQRPATATWYAYMDDITLEELPSCVEVVSVEATNIATTSAVLTWTDNFNTGATYTVSNAQGVVASGITGNSYTVTGLTPGTQYTFNVTVNCSATETTQPVSVTFYTACEALTANDLPYSETFESYGSGSAYSISPCWTKGTNNSTPYPYPTSTTVSGTRCLYFYGYKPSSATGTRYYSYAALPELASSVDVTGLTVSFKAKRYSSTTAYYRSIIYVGVMTDPTVVTTFQAVDTINMTPLAASTIESYSVNLANYAGTGKYVAFYCPAVDTSTSYSYNYIYIDDVVLDVTPSCEAPAITNVTYAPYNNGEGDYVASVTWNSTGAQSYEFQWVEPTLTRVISNGNDTVHAFVIHPDEASYVMVRAICGAGDTSAWSDSVRLYYGYCEPTPTSVDGSGVSSVAFGGMTNTTSHGGSTPGYINNRNMVGTVPAGTTATVDITYVTGYTYGTIIWVDWNKNYVFDSNEVVYVGTSESTNPYTLSASFMIPATQDTGNYTMRIMGADSYFDSYVTSIAAAANANPCATYSWGIAEDYTLHVSEAPSCMPVTALTASNITNSSVTLTWTDADNTGATYSVSDGTSTIASGITGTTYTATGLNANTDYTFYVVANCSSTMASSATSVSARTLCNAVSVPFVENFDTYTTSTTAATGVQVPCWTLAHKDVSWTNASYDPQVYYSTSYTHSGNYCLRLYYRGIYALPQISANINQLQMSFWVRQTSTAYKLVVGVMSDLNDATTFVPIDTIDNGSNTTSSVEHFVYFNNYTGNGHYIAFRNIHTSYNYSYNYIDDVTVDYLPSCFPVSNITATAITPNSITLAWDDTHNTGATYTVSDATGSTIASGITGTTYTVTGLTPNTDYTFNVVANCSANDASTVTSFTARTACAAEAFPFYEDFSANLSSNVCWRGATGTSAAQAFAGTPLNLTTPQWSYASSARDGLAAGHYYKNIYGSSTSQLCWMITPTIDLSNAATAQLEFDVALTDYGNAALPDLNGDTNTSQAFMVIVSTDGGNTWSANNATVWQNGTGNYTYASLADTAYQHKTISLNQYVGGTVRIAFYTQSLWSGGDNDLHLDNIAVTGDTLTANDPYALPLVCDFEQDGNNDWTLENGTQVNWWMVGNATNNGGNRALYITNDSSSNAYTLGTAAYVFAIRPVRITEAGVYAYSYDWKAYGESSYDFIRAALVPASTTITAGAYNGFNNTSGVPTGGIAIDGAYRLNLSSSWQTKVGEINVTDTGLYNIVFMWRNDNSGGTQPPAAIDNVSFYKTTCPMPQNVVANPTHNSITLTWTPAGNETSWEVSCGTTVQTVNTASYTFTGLTANTDYTVGVRALCSATESSRTVSQTVRTSCEPLATLPYTYGFEGDATGTSTGATFAASCWRRLNNGTQYFGYPYISSTASYCHTGTRSTYWYVTTTTGTYGDYQCLVLPGVNTTTYPVNTLRLKFWAKGSASTARNFLVGVMTNPTDINSFTTVETVTVNSTDWVEHTVVLDSYTGTGAYVAIRQNRATSTYTTYIDDITLEVAPTCVEPTGVTADNITTTSAVVSWTGTASGYAVAYGTGTNPDSMTTVFAAGTSTTLTGLTPNTAYNVYVKAVCSATDQSPWTNATTFRTNCVALTAADLPYFENFDSYTTSTTASTGVYVPCWTLAHQDVTMTAAQQPQIYYTTTASYNHSGNYTLRLYYRGIYAMPEITANINTLRMNFWVRQTATAYKVIVGVMSDLDDATTFVPIDTIDNGSNTSTMQQHTVDFSNYTGNGHYIAFRNIHTSYNYSYNYIDDVTVEVIPSCDAPAITNVTYEPYNNGEGDYLATVTWNDNGAQSYEFQWIEPTLTRVINNGNDTVHAFVIHPDEASYVKVRAICSAGDTSAWSDSVRLYYGYCEPTPTSVDGSGVSSVAFGGMTNTTSHGGSTPGYINNRNMVGTVQAGTPATVDITYATGYTYGTIIWVDWNKNYTFDGNEVVAVGTSENYNPTTLTLSFQVPSTQDTGDYVMRIMGADSYFDSYATSIAAAANANPCASYSWGIAEDYTLHVSPAPAGLDSTVFIISVNDTSMGTVLPNVGTLVYHMGDNVTITAVPNTGYNFAYWMLTIGNMSDTIDWNPISGTVDTADANQTYYLTAVFVPQPDSLTLVLAVNDATMGSTTPAPGTYRYGAGDVMTATATPATGYLFDYWIVNIPGLGTDTVYTASITDTVVPAYVTLTVNATAHFSACPAVSFPFSEGFEGGTMPACWTTSGPGTWTVGTGDYSSATGAHTGSNNARILHSSTNNVTKLITPAIDMTGVTNAELRFWHVQRSWAGDQDELTVYYRTSTTGAWQTLANYTNEVSTWTEEVIPLTVAGGILQVAFEMNDGYGYGVAIDDITVGLPPACAAVTALTASNVTYTSAVLTWADSVNTGATYSVYRNDTLLASGLTATTYTATGLTAETNYTFSVVANCDANTSSMPAYINVFTGYCSPTPTSVDGSGITSVAFGGMTNTTSHAGSTPGYVNNTNMVGTVPAGTTATVDITYATGYTYGTIIWVDWNNNMAFDGNEVVAVGTSDNNNPTTLTLTFDIPATQALGSYRMRIVGADSYFDSYTGSVAAAAGANPCGSYSWGVAEDYTLNVITAPNCIAVTGLTVSNITATGATLTWADSLNTGATYTVYDLSDTSVVATGITATTYTFTNLTANTAYNFGVVANCSATDASLMVTVGFSTPCLSIDVPYVECFGDNSTTRSCWTLDYPSASNAMGFVAYNGHTALRFSSYSSAQDYNQYAFSPVFNTPTTGDSLHVYVRYATYGSSDHLWFGYRTANDTDYTWTPNYYTTTGENDLQTFEANVPINAVQFGIHYYGSYAYYAWIDTMKVYPYTPSCQTTYGFDTIVACDSTVWNGNTYTLSGTYSATLTNAAGCDSVVTLNLTINNSTTGAETISACDSYTLNGITYTASATVVDTLTTLAGCDSVVTITLTVNHSTTHTDTVNAVDSYTWHGTTYIASTVAYDTLVNAAGCDSICILDLTITYSGIVVTDTAEACDSYTWRGTTYTASTVATDTVHNAAGADSIYMLILTVNYSQIVNDTVSACDSYMWHGTTYTASTTVADTLQTVAGCDSICTLTLTINHGATGTDFVTGCDSVMWNNNWYTASAIITDTLETSEGCDSIVAVTLLVNQSVTTTETVTMCDSYEWNGVTYTASTVDTTVFAAANGCDSTVVLDLTINYSTETIDSVDAVDSYTWRGNTYYVTTVAHDTLPAANGCDSVLTLVLNMSYSANIIDTLVACDSATWHGRTYYASTVDRDTIGNDIYLLLLTINNSVYDTLTVTARGQYVWHDSIYTVSGIYNYYDQTNEGCDYVETLILTIDTTTDVYYSVAIVVANTEGEIGVGGTVAGAGSYLAGTEVTLTATPDEGYLFDGWYTRSAMGFGGQLIVADSVYTFTLDSNVVVVAMFERIGANSALLTVSVDSTMGYVLFNGERAPFNVYRGTLGDTVTLEAVPMAGNCVFVGWVNAEGDTLSHDATYDYVLDRTTTTLTAAFVRNEGIDNVDATSVTIFTRENGVVVRGAAQAEVYVFDVVGRMVGHVSAANDEEFIRLPQTGVFLVKVGNLPARRVVVRQ